MTELINKSQIEAILFDMDGVLVDVSQSYRIVVKKTVEFYVQRNIDFSEIAAYKFKGGYNNDWDITAALIKYYGKKVKYDDVVAKFQEFYVGKNHDGLMLNEKWLLAENILQELQKDFKLGIVTGRLRSEADFALKRYQMTKYFPEIITMKDTTLGKPDPAGILIIMDRLNIKSAVYLGDTIDDMVAASKANIIRIGILTEDCDIKKQTELLKSFGAVKVLDRANNIKEIFV